MKKKLLLASMLLIASLSFTAHAEEQTEVTTETETVNMADEGWESLGKMSQRHFSLNIQGFCYVWTEKEPSSVNSKVLSYTLLNYEQAEAVFYFQMNGCLAINRMMIKNHCTDWTVIQKTIDSFIKAGIEALLN